MREIKYRARALHGKIWVYGHYYKDKGEHIIVSECNSCIYPYNEKFYPHTKIDVNTLGQYTGLKDINGKEIYEGDILKAKTTAIIIKEVVYDEDYARFGLKDKEEIYDVMQEIYALSKEKIQSLKFEVIGNIYENKELLKNEK